MDSQGAFGDFAEKYRAYEGAEFVIVPVPYDKTSTWGKGADKGPAALLAASYNLENYDIETGTEVYRKGIFTDDPVSEDASPEAMVLAVRERVQRHLEHGKTVVALGGEHSITIGAVQAHLEHYPDLSVLQLDAHSDLRPEYHGSPLNHACVMARVREMCPIMQVGIRSMDVLEQEGLDRARICFCDPALEPGWQQKVLSCLSENVYVTIDLDVFDPAVMPSTGTPEPGGLSWREVTGLLRLVAKEKTIVGFDVVELCPDGNRAPEFLAAKLVYKTLSYIEVGGE